MIKNIIIFIFSLVSINSFSQDTLIINPGTTTIESCDSSIFIVDFSIEATYNINFIVDTTDSPCPNGGVLVVNLQFIEFDLGSGNPANILQINSFNNNSVYFTGGPIPDSEIIIGYNVSITLNVNRTLGSIVGLSFCDCLQPLPVELVNFSVNNTNDFDIINWTTASEVNNNFFTLEFSKNGFDFIKLTDIHGAGNSSTTNHYNFINYDISEGHSYYRLKQTDFNGDYEIFKIISSYRESIIYEYYDMYNYFISNDISDLNKYQMYIKVYPSGLKKKIIKE